tara:strand:- start:1833 stop:3701 length:1869 start_codon:yes stop_codon:yes gene_type:complete
MTSLPFTNLDISNAYKGHDSAKKIMMGHTHIWPGAPVFSFDTSQIGGELNFKVSSDTSYVACTVNDSDIYIFSTNSNIKNTVRATPNNDRYLLSDTAKTIDISLPMFKRSQATITGTGTSIARYGADLRKGTINVRIANPFDTAVSFSISVPGKGTQTKSCPAGSIIDFQFSSLSGGTYTVTLNNLTANDVRYTTVFVNDTSASIQVQSLTLKLLTSGQSIGSFDNTIRVYCLTEQEALDNYTNAYGPKAIISVDLRTVGSYNPTSNYGYKVAQVFFKILHGGVGYPANSTIQVSIPNVQTWFQGFKGGYYAQYTQPFFNMVTNSNGTVTGIVAPTYRFGESIWGSDWNNNSNSMYFPNNGGDNNAVDARQFSGNDLSTTLPHDYFYTAFILNGWSDWGQSATYGKTILSVLRTAIDRNAINITGNGNQGIDLIVGNTGQHAFGNQGTWFKNLLFDNTDSEGNLQTVELGNINVSNIKSQSQPHLQLIQSNYIQTTTNKTGNSKVAITNNPKFKSMHGSGITYTYQTGTWPAGFDPLLYRQSYPNTIGAAYSSSDFEGLWYHYKTWGAAQGFTHSDDFLAQDYLDLHADLRAAFGSTGDSARTSAMLHWFSDGIAEGRQGRK